MFLFFTCFIYSVKILKAAVKQEIKLLTVLISASLAGYQIISFFDFPLERIEHQVLVMTDFALINFLYIQSRTEKTIIKAPGYGTQAFRYVFIIILLAICSFSLVICTYRCIGEYHTGKLYAAHHAARWNEMITEADKAENFFYTMDPMSAPIEWYKGVAYFSTGNIQSAMESFGKAYKVHPYHIHVLNNLAGCYEKKKEHLKAIELYNKALNISPAFYESRLNLSAVYFNMGKFNDAFITIDRCPLTCSDSKYNSFLPAILKAKVTELTNREQDSSIKIRLTLLLENENKIKELYIQSKKNNCNFTEIILSDK
jgi:tetratricopeptide (TPR) repeat protein